MLDGLRHRLKDPRERRGGYSVRKHLGRLRREGRLPQIGLAAVALLTIGGLAFGQCDASSLTGPSASSEAPLTSTVAGGSVTSAASVGSETFKENTVERNVVFSGINPCNGDMVRAIGKRHDKIRIVATPTSFTTDHHINDSFRGEAVNDPSQAYTGSDVHTDRFEFGIDGVEHRELTNEHLIAQGQAPNWILHVHQRSDFRFEDPLNPVVTFKGHASCPPESPCTLAGGCVDRELEVLTTAP